MAATQLTSDARGFVNEVATYIKGNGKASAVPKVTALFGRVTARAKKENVAHVTSAVVLSAQEKERIAKMLAKRLGHEVTLETHVENQLLGGMRIQVGDWILDTSLRGNLGRLASALKQS